jgi:hypothetical protein
MEFGPPRLTLLLAALNRRLAATSTAADEVAHVHRDVPGDHPKERGRDVPPGMKRYGDASAIGVAVLAV